ncbi:hypothetical protein POM88_035948 [Heracleum sosnowskyi]|uniref:FAD/NAD(P)-binding domain-containing protein n=1 Tax=Heracleum sosnowskyi TaxID=360622 RepID=A0AAD8MDR7_9APIA|nr:hypothetical protein POM88_035948 [Heracleum sosnowskyi]
MGVLLPMTILSLPLVTTSHTRKQEPRDSNSSIQDNGIANYEKIKSSRSILIVVGGGPTGVELAGEIAVDFPEKKVTLVHNGSRLLEMLGPKAAKRTLDWLTWKKVDVKFNQKVNLSNIAEETVLRDSLDVSGRLMVDENLRIKGCKNIFAIGDITDLKEMKQGVPGTRTFCSCCEEHQDINIRKK